MKLVYDYSRIFILVMFIFLNNNLWGQIQQLGNDIVGASAHDLLGGHVSLNADGSVLAVSEPQIAVYGGTPPPKTHDYVRVYDWSGTAWIERSNSLTGAIDEFYGTAISLSDDGNLLAVSSRVASPFIVGYVNVYQWNGSAWSQQGDTLWGAGMNNVLSSLHLSADGSVLAIGASTSSSGYAQVYEWNGTAWVQRGNNFFGPGLEHDVNLSADGNTLIVGEPDYGSPGKVSVYDWDGSTWVQRGNTITGEDFGNEVSLSRDGNTFAFGAPYYDDNNITNVGLVRVYSWDGAAWVQQGNDLTNMTAYESFGLSVSLNSVGNKLIVQKWQGTLLYEWDSTASTWNNIMPSNVTLPHGEASCFARNTAIFAIGNAGHDSNGLISNGMVRAYGYNSTITPISTIDKTTFDVAIYPNPTPAHLYIENKEDLPLQITITNQLGQITKDQELQDKTTMLNLSNLPAGMYFLTLSNGIEVITKKIRKE